MTEIIIPIFVDESQIEILGAPASISETIKTNAGKILTKISLDLESLNECVDSINSIAEHLKAYALNGVVCDSLSLELGVSLSGKVGFLGSGVETECAAKLQITFKVNKLSQ